MLWKFSNQCNSKLSAEFWTEQNGKAFWQVENDGSLEKFYSLKIKFFLIISKKTYIRNWCIPFFIAKSEMTFCSNSCWIFALSKSCIKQSHFSFYETIAKQIAKGNKKLWNSWKMIQKTTQYTQVINNKYSTYWYSFYCSMKFGIFFQHTFTPKRFSAIYFQIITEVCSTGRHWRSCWRTLGTACRAQTSPQWLQWWWV